MPATDGTLLERWIARRDAEAFDELVSRYADLVYGVCRRIVRNGADAEDLVQSCFLKLAVVATVPRSSLPGWLHTVATRNAVDFLRASSRRRNRERRFAEARPREEASPVPSWDELQVHIDECVAALPPHLREVIVAHFLERRTHEEVASSLDVSRQTVSHRIQKGVERLRVLLRKRGLTAPGAVLTAFLGGLPVEAAPADLLGSLGRVALAGLPAGVVGASAAWMPITEAGGLIVAKKLLIAAAAAAVLILVGFSSFQALRDREEEVAWAPSLPSPVDRAAPPPPVRQAAPAQAPEGREPTGSTAVAGPLHGRLLGTVLDAEGRPVARAKVLLVAGAPAAPTARKPEKLGEATTDESGRFALDPAVRDDLVVWSFKSGAGLGAVAAGPDPLEVVLERLGEVSGRFYDRDTAEGIAGLPVRLSRSGSGGASPDAAAFHSEAWALFPELQGGGGETVTDPEGRYVLRDLSPVHLRFQFTPDRSDHVLPGFRRDDSIPEVLLARGERRTGVDFALQRGGSIAGTVFGPDGKELAGARVDALSSYPGALKRSLRSAPDGSYRFAGLAPDATYVLSASHAGLPPAESPLTALSAGEEVVGVEIHLVRGHAVRGRILDDLGQPVPGLRLFLSKVLGPERWIPGYAVTVTGDDGGFSLNDVGPGHHILNPSPEGHRPDQVFPFTMPAGRELSGLEFVLRRKGVGFISGRVVDHTGKPLGGFPISAGNGMKKAATALSGEDGAFRLEGLEDAEAYTITAYSGDHWSQRKPNVPLYATDVTVVVIPRGRIVGRVVEAGTRRPVEHFEFRAVFIRHEPEGENRYHTKWTPHDSPTGEFLIERAEPVECEIQVRADRYVEAKSSRFVVPPGETAGEVVIALAHGASVKGIVRDAGTGEPLRGVLVRAHQHEVFQPWLLEESKASYAPRGVWKLTMSREDGSFEVGGLDAGDVIHLVAWKEGYGPTVRPGVAVGGAGSGLELPLAPAAALRISARFRPQAGVAYEFHAYHRAEKPWRSAVRATAAAERPCAVEMPGLPPGPYRLAVYSVRTGDRDPARWLLGERRLELSPGERREVPLDLSELTAGFAAVTVRVVGPADPGAANLRIFSQEDPEEPYGDPVALADGRFRFAGLPPGSYLVLGARTGTGPAAQARLPLEVTEGQERAVELKVE